VDDRDAGSVSLFVCRISTDIDEAHVERHFSLESYRHSMDDVAEMTLRPGEDRDRRHGIGKSAGSVHTVAFLIDFQ